MSVCDKCGREVHPVNDATVVEAYAFPGHVMMLALSKPRHFLPLVEDGKRVCEGSPSRAQYIEGQPRDTRGFPYNPKLETKFREAYARVLAKYSAQ